MMQIPTQQKARLDLRQRWKQLMLIVTAVLSVASVNVYAAGALAIDKNQGPKWGWAVDFSSYSQAESKAISQCGEDCRIVQRFANQCAAYAADQSEGSGIYGWGTANTSGEAQSRALSECSERNGKSCIVRAWGCDQKSPGKMVHIVVQAEGDTGWQPFESIRQVFKEKTWERLNAQCTSRGMSIVRSSVRATSGATQNTKTENGQKLASMNFPSLEADCETN